MGGVCTHRALPFALALFLPREIGGAAGPLLPSSIDHCCLCFPLGPSEDAPGACSARCRLQSLSMCMLMFWEKTVC